MVDIEGVRQFVEQRIAAALERPQMYASSPEALEDVLCTLDEIQRKMTGQQSGRPSEYSQFLVSRGYGAATFCGRERLTSRAEKSSDEDLRLFQALAQFWREYLEARPAAPANG